MNKIYTKTGDKGKTSLFNGQRVLKSDPRVNAYGTIDELNCSLGLVVESIKSKAEKGSEKLKKELIAIQNDLFSIGSALANPESEKLPSLVKRVSHFEKLIDQMTTKLSPLKNFILPGGGKAGAQLHVARTICRRAERILVKLSQKHSVDQNSVVYLNRLSDLLFTMARYVNRLENKKETIWKKGK